MACQGLEVADVIRTYREDFENARSGRLTSVEKRVLDDITACRTAAMGGHVDRCDRCGHLEISYNSCRNRHCPKCLASAPTKWLSARESDLLPVDYFHVVFTIPREIATIALQNKRIVYNILFRSASETLRQVAADPKHLGAEIGFLAVLHTWGQNLEHHPHVHCVIPGGGISPDRTEWLRCRQNFFLSVKVLSRLFRGKFLHYLLEAFKKGKLEFHGQLLDLRSDKAFRAHLAPLYTKEWFVFSKAPFGGPAQVLKYLARYTHRVAISNRRLVSMNNGNVSFLWKDYANGCRRRVMTLTAVEFIRRFLTHILPKGFMRIRHYGFLANRYRKQKLEQCRRLLDVRIVDVDVDSTDDGTSDREPPDNPQEKQERTTRCPACKHGQMIQIFTLKPGQALPAEFVVQFHDTS